MATPQYRLVSIQIALRRRYRTSKYRYVSSKHAHSLVDTINNVNMKLYVQKTFYAIVCTDNNCACFSTEIQHLQRKKTYLHS